MNHTAPDPQVIESYRAALAEHGPTPQALGWTKGKQPARYAALVGHLENGFDLLDYGCGLAHLSDWLDQRDVHGTYSGCDVVLEALNLAANRVKGLVDNLHHIGGPQDITDDFENIVCCGVFTRMGGRSEFEHIVHVKDTLAALFARTRVGLHVDFMDSMMVDTPKPGEFYAAPWDVLALARSMSSRVVIDTSYLPYEFCVHIYKGDAIERPANVYKESI